MSVSRFCVLIDGEIRSTARVALDLSAPALLSGAGLYETMRVTGGGVLHLERHLERLAASTSALGFPAPPESAVLAGECARVAAAAGEGLLRVVLLHLGRCTQRVIQSEELPADSARPVQLGFAEPAFDGPRPLAQHKTLNGLSARVAFEAGQRAGFDEVLLRMPDGRILEGTRSTFFLVTKGRLCTPSMTLPILPGITRELLLEAAARHAIPVEERDLVAADVLAADEAFIAASVRGIRAVATLEHQTLPCVNGPITRLLAEAMHASTA